MSDSEPGTPDLNIAGFGHTQEIASPTPMGDRAQQLLVYDSEEEPRRRRRRSSPSAAPTSHGSEPGTP